MSWRLSDDERDRLEVEGYLVRHDVFAGDEVSAIVTACEELVDRVVADRVGTRLTMGSYVFEPAPVAEATIKWEGDSDVVHGIEPFVHLSPELERWAHDARFTEPMIDLVDDADPQLFTEKLNLKRAGHGGANPLHQDYPYWVDPAARPDRLATAILFLDDATIENGCLEVPPGSHRDGVWRTRRDGAGALVMFGPLLVHRSAPNTSEADRRALLYTYQPAGLHHMLDHLRSLLGTAPG